jgi:hypothetical protein
MDYETLEFLVECSLFLLLLKKQKKGHPNSGGPFFYLESNRIPTFLRLKSSVLL